MLMIFINQQIFIRYVDKKIHTLKSMDLMFNLNFTDCKLT